MATNEHLEYIWLVDSLIYSETGRHLDSLTRQIIEGILKGKTYSEIAGQLGYDSGYIGDKSRAMLRILSEKTGETVNKKNFSWMIERVLKVDFSQSVINFSQIQDK